ncbi:Transglycosylase [Leptospira santarosai]|uniref:Transglycosylase n=1 Tax=Leptospira santarosai TaxID=28183 RepID=A0A2P1QVX0_9LEPT|nr:Transglycosylase [Leptospira santarosai]
MDQEDVIVYYEQIQKFVSKLDQRNLVKFIIKKIRETERIIDISKRKFDLWNLFFLLKMAVRYGSSFPQMIIKDEHLVGLHNLCRGLNNFVPPEIGPPNYISATKVLRLICYQQFWLQYNLIYQDVGRVIKLIEYSELDPASIIDSELNISTQHFLKYTYVLFVWVKQFPQTDFFDLDAVSSILEDKQMLKSITNSLKKDLIEMKAVIESSSPIESKRLEAFEQSTLFRFPIWEIEGELYLVSTKLLEKFILHFLIEKLSRISSFETENCLSKGFEKYIELYLLEGREKYLSEESVRNKYSLSEGKKVTDFLITSSYGNIYLECKAILVQPLTKVFPKSEVLIKSYKDSIIKALVQGIDTDSYEKINSKMKKYILIVTLEDTYFGSFYDTYDEFIKDGLIKYYPGYESAVASFGFDKIFIISISDYEYIMTYSRQEEKVIVQLLDELSVVLLKKKRYLCFRGFLQDFIKEKHGKDYLLTIDTLQNATNSLFQEIKDEIRRTIIRRT